MTPRASSGQANAFSRCVADAISHLIGMSGRPVAQVIADAGFSRNYYYKRARHEMPFNTNDISQIAQAIDLEPDAILEEALNRNRLSNVIVGGFGNNADIEDEIPENVEEAWAGRFAASPKSDIPEDHTP